MRLICPHCQLSVTLPDVATPAPCPQCGASITPPALTGAAIDAAPEPVVAPASAVAPPPAVSPPASRVASAAGVGAGRPVGADAARLARSPWFHLTLRREVAHWLAPGALVLVFLLTSFTWVAIAPNGTRIYTQTAWQAAGGGFTTDVVGDRVMHAEAELKAHTGMSVWLLFFIILLIPTAVIAVADRVLARNPAGVPDIFRAIWPHRQMVVAGLCLALLLLLLMPVMTTFGLESAAAAVAATPATTAAAPEPTTAEKAERDLQRDIQLPRFGLERTIWLKLAVVVQFIAVAGIGMAWWLDRHPNAPDPRLEIYC